MLEIILIFALIAFIIKPKPGIIGCGLSGFSGINSYNSEKIKFLLYWNSQERGKDATGIFTPKTGIVKNNIEAKEFINDVKLISKVKKDNVLIGHVRAKTIGHNSVENAHPFEYGDITLAHNGTLENHLELTSVYSLKSSDYKVDSQVLAKCIEINFKFDDKVKALEQYQGAVATLFYNKSENILYAYHDNKRPLYYGFVDKTELYISSIKDSLTAIDCKDILEFEVNTLYKIKDGVIISKQLYEPIKKSNYTEIILADKFDLSIKNKAGISQVKSSKKNISGIFVSNVNIGYIKGFWLKTNKHGFERDNTKFLKKQHLINNQNWYYVLGKPENLIYKNETDYFEVRDTLGNEGIICKIDNFNTTNFIPQVNKYVTVLKNLTFKKDNVTLCQINDLAIVKEYFYGSNLITIENPITGLSGVCTIECVRVSNNTEIDSFLYTKNKKNEVIDFTKTKIKEKVEIDTLPDLPKVDVLKLLENNKIEEIPDCDNSLTYSYNTVCNIISDVYEGISGLTNLLRNQMNEEALKQAIDLENDIIQLYDIEILEQFIPDDEYPFDKDENEDDDLLFSKFMSKDDKSKNKTNKNNKFSEIQN